MSDDTLNPDAIRADMEAGTPGPWTTPYDDHDCYVDTPGESVYTFIGKNSAPLAAAIVHSAFGQDKRLDANARRIARLPDLERGYLDMRARAEAAEEDAKRAWMDCNQEDLHFVMNHPEAVTRHFTKYREDAERWRKRAETVEAKTLHLEGALCEAMAQLRWLNEKEQRGSTNTVLARLEHALRQDEGDDE